MWFLNTIPNNIQQTFFIDSIELSRQLTNIRLDIEWDDKKNLYIILPYPYSYGKKNGSIEFLRAMLTNQDQKTVDMKNKDEEEYITFFEDCYKFRDFHVMNNTELCNDYSLSSIVNQYKHDDFGICQFKVPYNDNHPTQKISIEVIYKFKLHYSSELFIPVQISNFHSMKPDIQINTDIKVKNCFVPYKERKYNYTWDGDICHIQPIIHPSSDKHNRIYMDAFDIDLFIPTVNWESSDDEKDISDNEDRQVIKDFMTKVGILDHDT